MPEYLAPGVYVEEFEIGARPIEGVSTSTAGFVGVAERGPLNKPTLVTSFGEYLKIFGGYLSEETYKKYRWLPYAVEGFFQNSGKRVYVTRVADSSAAKASGNIPDISGISTALAEKAAALALTIKLQDTTGIVPDDQLMIKDEMNSEFVKVSGPAKTITLAGELASAYPKDTALIPCKEEILTGVLKTASVAGVAEVDVTDTTGIVNGATLLVKDADDKKYEFCTVIAVDAGTVKLQQKLTQAHAKDTVLCTLKPTTTKVKLAADTKTGSSVLAVDAKDTALVAGSFIQIVDVFFLIKGQDSSNVLLLTKELRYDHPQGKLIKKLVPGLKVSAVNPGIWGNDIKLSVKEGSITQAKLVASALNQNYLELDTVNSIEVGTLLRLPSPDDKFATVEEVFRTGLVKRVNLDCSVTLSKDALVKTAEFSLKVTLGEIEELFLNLSMDSRHSRHVKQVVNDGSTLVSVEVVSAASAPSEKLPMPTEEKEPAWKLAGGVSGIPTDDMAIDVYKGVDDPEPSKRKGFQTLKNVDEISIVAIPGMTDQALQNEIISHCEAMKDRFGILDAAKNNDLDAIKTQRNLFDSRYAALYYPWLTIYDPTVKKNTQSPPSGYIAGVYARTDVERGVHKAPANEKLNNVIDLERIITAGQQDILNPMGINCVRVFPGRGVRVWGARTISSDSIWKYVNVRRLFIYIEESLDKGIQWVVFEPNDIPLWARVRQTVSQFLIGVWRSGALAGATPEEAFFVKCDRTTMTQDDIDNGRLICVIGVAPVKPAEFVIIRIAQWTAGAK